MQKVLVDLFVVPEESRSEFLTAARRAQNFLKTLPGFVEGFLYEKKDGGSRYNLATTAVWKDEAAFENAKRTVAEEYRKTGYDPQETTTRLKIETVRSIYERFPY